MLPELIAVRFHRELSTGATRPCVFSCEEADGTAGGEYVVKFRSEVRGNETGLMFETIAALLALELSIPMPPAATVLVDTELAESVPDAAVVSRVRASAGLNFGTRFLSPGYMTWLRDDPVPVSLRRAAAETLAFDALIDNADRRRDKPNLLWKDGELFLIDHEMAFSFTRVIGADPSQFSELQLSFLREHPFYAGLRGKQLELDRFAGELEALSDERVSRIFAQVPHQFGTMYLENIRERLINIRQNVASFIEAVRRVVQ